MGRCHCGDQRRAGPIDPMPRPDSHGNDAHRDAHALPAPAEDHAAQRHDVGEVGAPGERDVALVGARVVGRVELDPAVARRIGRDPGVRGVDAEQARPPRRRLGAAGSPRRSAPAGPWPRRQASMTWAKSWQTPLRCSSTSSTEVADGGRAGLELEVGVDAAHQVGRSPRASRGRARSSAPHRRAPRRTTAPARSARSCRAGSRSSCAGSRAHRVAHRFPGDRRGAGSGRAARRPRPAQSMRTRSSGCGPCTAKWVTPLPNASRSSCRSSGAGSIAQLVRDARAATAARAA